MGTEANAAASVALRAEAQQGKLQKEEGGVALGNPAQTEGAHKTIFDVV